MWDVALSQPQINDVIAKGVGGSDVPEPSPLVGVMIFGLGVALLKRKALSF